MTNQQSTIRQSGKTQQAIETGAEPDLRRALGAWGAAAFVVTSMIGTGIFTVPAFVRTATGNGVASLGVWITGATLALFGAFCYAELATRMPRAGGEYQYLSNVYGRPWGFIGGWITFFAGFAAPMAASTLAAVAYFSELTPGWNPNTPLITDSASRRVPPSPLCCRCCWRSPIQSACGPAADCKRRWPR